MIVENDCLILQIFQRDEREKDLVEGEAGK
jgi:hypothetical protein